MTFNITPDWTVLWTAKQAEEQLTGFKFKGPGWYFGTPCEREAALVVPHGVEVYGHPSSAKPSRTIWRQKWSEEQVFRFSFYYENPCPSFNAVANAPVRDGVLPDFSERVW